MRRNTFVSRVQHLSRKAMGNNVENINHQRNISLITWRQNSKTGCKAHQYVTYYPTDRSVIKIEEKTKKKLLELKVAKDCGSS